LLVVLAVVFSFVALIALYGYNQTWLLWNIPVMSPPFADLRVITHGADSISKGLDPLVSNPGDPWGRPLNYPRIWQSLYLIGINKSHTIGLGLGIISSFLLGVVLVLPNSSNRTLALTTGALISPAVLLGIERANIDLFIFFLVAVTIYLARKSALLADALIICSTALKLFPVFGITLFLRMRRRSFFKHMMLVMAILSLYLAVMLPEMRLISLATPRAIDLSYGINVAWMHMESINHSLGFLLRIICFALVLVVACLSVVAYKRSSILKIADQWEGSLSLDSFRVGSSIYIGTFLLGNNWDYRLAFLILVIPQLSLWMLSPSRQLRCYSIAATFTLLASMWYLVISKIWSILAAGLISLLPVAKMIPWLFDELSNWSLFFLLTYLFFLVLPEWTKNLLRYSSRPARRCP